MSESFNEPKPFSPVQPVALGLAERFRFRCHKGIPCFNKCCENTDILLTPYDVVRLKNRLDLSSREFIDRYTSDSELDAHGTPGLKLGHREGSQACVFLTPEGCGVYEDRACGLPLLRARHDVDAQEGLQRRRGLQLRGAGGPLPRPPRT